MVDVEEYFPRGGKKPISKTFKQSGNFLGVPEKGEKKKKKPKKKSEGDDGYLSDENINEQYNTKKNFIVGLNYKTIKEGVLILARIRNVQETKLLVMMPGRMIGSVMACHISEPYNKILEAYVNDEVEMIRELPKMFRPGQYIAVKVLEVEGEKVMLSTMPQHINGGKKFADLHKSTVLQAAVSSIEDHGYVMDIGIPNTRAFLPKSEYNPELDLDIGMVTWCAIKSVSQSPESSIVTLSTTLAALQHGVIRHKPDTPLLPGSNIQFSVETPMDNGIQGQVFDDTTAFILRQHADKVKGKKPALGQKITARVLYVMPTRKAPFLTMKNIFETTFPDLAEEQKFKDGDIIEDAQVLSISGRGVVFRLRGGATGCITLKRIHIDEDLTDQEVIAKSYPIGSTHRVRVICYNLCDYMYSVSDEPHVLAQKYFSLDQLRVGQLVDATVKNIAEAHVVLNFGRFTGMVPHSHITEAGLIRDPKKGTSYLAKHKYKVGQEVRARVLTVDPVRRALFLTMKPSLLKPDLEVLSSVEQAEVGKAYTGIIKYIKDYILVAFFDNVMAYVPRHYVTKDPAENLMEAFHVGQIVNCTILTVDLEKKRLFGSLTTTPFWPAKKREKRKQTSQETEVPQKKQRSSDENSDDSDNDLQNEESDNKKNKKSKAKKKTEETKVTEIEQVDKNNKKGKKQKVDADAQVKDKKKIDKKSKEDDADKITPKRKRQDTELSSASDHIDTDIAEDENVTEDVISKQKSKKEKKKSKDKQVTQVEEVEIKSKKRKKATEQPESQEVDTRTNKENIETEQIKEIQEEPKGKKAKKKKKKVDKGKTEDTTVEVLTPALDVPCTKDFWSAKLQNVAKDEQQEESSDSEDEDVKDQKKKRKKLSVKEKLEKARAEEERIRDMERRAIESESQPRSSDQFERALLANPNSSQLWIAYMAFHLQATEIEKARAVARKALNTISFREEAEKLNVWLALLNLENCFGTKESQQKTLEEALQMNETLKVHSKLLDIYVETGKQQELSSLVELMLRKYRREPDVYVRCGQACFTLALVDKARHVMQKAISVLPPKQHVPVLVQFALLEGKHGALERSEALFEQVLAVYPERVDVCSAYIDMLLKRSDVERVREVLGRLTSQKLPARKMKILFKKWIDVEQSIGDSQKLEEVQRRAQEFVQTAMS